MAISYEDGVNQNFDDLSEDKFDDLIDQKIGSIANAPVLSVPLMTTTAPIVTNLTTSVNFMGDDGVLDRSDIGVSTFTITIDFDQPMNTTLLPTISFPTLGEDPGALFTFTGFVWSNGNQTYTLTFTVNDLEVELEDVDIQVSGAQNSSGDVLTSVVVADVFSIDLDGDSGDDLAVSFDDGNGFIDSSEDITAVDFTVSGLDDDSTAIVTLTGVDAMGMSITQTANVSADGSLTVDLSGFAAGTVTATIASTDNAGNTATGAGDSSTIDGSADTDGNLSLTISDVAVNAADGDMLSFDVAGLDGDLASAVVTFSDGMNMIMVDVSGGDGTYSVDLSGLNDGNITSVLDVTDNAGNTANDNGADIDLDRTADVENDLAINVTDTVINQAESSMVGFMITGLDADAASAIVTFTDGINSQTVDVSGGNGSYSVDLSGLNDGIITSSLAVTDDAGNMASATGADITMDTDVPDAPIISSISTDSGASSSDGVTNDNEVTIFGTAEANAFVEVFADGISIGIVQANSMGNWSLNFPEILDEATTFVYAGLIDGTYSLTAVATDVAGNSSGSSAIFTLEIDTDDPDAPVISSAITNDAGVSDSDGTTTDATPTLSLTAEAGSSVEVFIDGISAGFAVETMTAGTFTFTPAAALMVGAYDFTAIATDLAGNSSLASAALTLSISEFAEITAITDDENADTMDGLNDGTGTVVEGDAPDTASTSGTISFEDFAAGQTHTITAILPPPGALGNFSVSLLNSATDDGVGVAGWSFSVANADIDFLDAGDTITQNYIVRITDGDGNETDQAITIIILGTDDAAVITADETGAVSEGDIGDAAVTAIGSIAVTDADDDDNPSFADVMASGTYGSLVVNAAGDSWTYTLDQSLVQDMDAGDMVDDVITLTDDEGNSVDITITITGTDDDAIITGDTTQAVTEGDIGDAPVTVTGAIGVSDVDADDNPSFANVGEVGLYGVLIVNAAGDAWTYTLNQAAVQDLDDGDMVDDVITLTDDEGNTRDITITVTGTADQAVITADTTGAVSEGDIGDTVTTTGAIAVSDADADDNPSFANATDIGVYGTITVNAAGDEWTYTLDQSTVQDLDAGNIVTDTLTLIDDEGNEVDIDITITGTNDEPIAAALMGIVTEDGTPSISASNGAQSGIPNNGFFYILDYDTGTMTAVARTGSQVNADVAPTNGMVVQINPNSSSFAVSASTYSAGVETFVDPATFAVFGYLGTSNVAGDGLLFDDSASDISIEINAASIVTPDGTADFNVTISGLDFTDGIDSIDIDDLTFDVQPIDSSQVTVTASATDIDDSSVLTYSIDTTGTLGRVVNNGDGTFTYDSDNQFEDLAAGETTTDTFTYTADDGLGGTSTETVTITITGSNDAPIISAGMGDTDVFNLTEADGVTSMGTLTVTDVDLSDTVSVAVSSVAESGDVSGIANGTLLAMLGVDMGDIIDNMSDEGTINLDFDSGLEDFDYLAVGDTLTLIYTVTVTDSQHATDSYDVTVNIAGTNDGPVITTPMGGNEGAVTEDTPVVELTPLPTGTDIQVNIFTTGSQDNASITALNDGGFVVTWESAGQDTSGDGIYGQRYDAMGVATGLEFQVNSTTTGPQTGPAVTATDDGGFVVIWTAGNAQDGNNSGIFGQRFDDMGAIAGVEFQVNTTTLETQFNPSATALSGSGFVVTWESVGQDGDRNGVFGQQFDASGNFVGTEFQVNTETINSQRRPSVTALDDGGFVVVWDSLEQDGDDTGIYGQRYDNMSMAVGAEFQVNTFTTRSQVDPSVTGLNDGGFVVTWNSATQDGNSFGLFGQRYDAAGAAAGLEFQVNTFTNSGQTDSSVTSLDDGGFVVIWASRGQDGDNLGVYGQRFDDMGLPVGVEFLVNDTTAGVQFVGDQTTVDQLSDGRLVVTFSGRGTEEVFVRIIDVPDASAPTTNATTGQITASDADTGAVLTFTGDAAGIYGDFVIDADTGEWTYTLDETDADTDALTEGQIVTETFTVTVTDDQMATTTQDVTITITGTNDGPMANDVAAGTFPTVDEDEMFMGELGGMGLDAIPVSLFASDVDSVLDASSFSFDGASIDGGASVSAALAGITYEAMTGDFTFDGSVDAYQYLGENETVDVVVDFTVTDDNMATDTGTVTFTVRGTNDDPVIDAMASDLSSSLTVGDLDDMMMPDTVLTDSGSIVFDDVDVTDTQSAAITDVSFTGDDSGITVAAATALLSLMTTDAAGAGNPGAVDWDFNASDALFAYLPDMDTVTISYEITVTDSSGGTAVETVSVTITGVNDTATISASAMEDTSVTEAGGDNPIGTLGDPDAGGTLSVSDVDTGEDVFEAAASADLVGDYGTFTFNETSGVWTYILDNANSDVQALSDGETLTDTLTVSSVDGTDSYDIDVTINGTDDAATVESGSVLAAQVDERADGAIDENTGVINTTGTIIFDDAELLDTHNVTFTPITGPGTTDSIVDYIGTFSSNFTQAATGADTGMITWNFDVNAADLDFLDEGETLVQLYQYSITGDDGAELTQIVTITIVGVEDAAEVSGDVTGTVTEGDIGDVAETATGTLTIIDPDLLDNVAPLNFVDVAATTGDSGYGTFEITAGMWTFTLDQSAVQGLNTGETVQDSFTFTATDGTTQTVTVDIDGADEVFVGTPNAETITGTNSVDMISGLGGDDIIFALDGDDTVFGGDGNDTINGGGGRDILYGEDGDDILNGDAGNDDFFGGAGSDTFNGGEGADRVLYSNATSGVVANFINPSLNMGEAAGDTYNSIESITGSNFDDVITSGNDNNDLIGLGGDDVLIGARGRDRLFGGEGNDRLLGGLGNDDLHGQGGADTYVIQSGAGSDRIFGYEVGVDVIQYVGGPGEIADLTIEQIGANTRITSVVGVLTLMGIDATTVTAADFAFINPLADPTGVTVTTDLTTGDDNFTGDENDDVVNGLDGNDVILGGIGDDTLNGGGGDDFLTGGLGADILDGGAGIDRVLYSAASTGVTINLLDTSLNTGEAAGDSYISIEVFSLSNDADIITGDNDANQILGLGGNDILNGLGGNDILFGGSEDDRLTGGDGNDLLRGGDGEDTFIFGVNSGNDTISDFEDGVDTIEFRGTMDEFTDLVITQDGADTVITSDNGVITLTDFDSALLDVADFTFI